MITKEQAIETFKSNKVEVYRYCKFFHALLKHNTTKLPIEAIRIGTTRVWHKDSSKFEIPIRIGQVRNLVINEKNAHEWSIER